MKEEWRSYKNTHYLVSNHGQIYSKLTKKILKQGLMTAGYMGLRLGRKNIISVHRLVCEMFNGPPPSRRHQVAHNDGDKLNNRADNLRWATPRENQLDRHKHGTMTNGGREGIKNFKAKLTEELVKEIRSSPMSTSEWAKKLGVTYQTIRNVRLFLTWKHIK